MEFLLDRIFGISEDIRYVAVYSKGVLHMKTRDNLADASDSESDTYEELFVNPTMIKLVTQRGNVDCGGCSGVVIYYGNFFQYVRPLKEGHVSVALSRKADPHVLVKEIDRVVDSMRD